MQASVVVKDVMGRTQSMTLNFEAGITTIADAQTALTAWITDFEAASGAAVVSATLSANLTVPGNAADAGSNIDEGFVLTFTMVDGDNLSVRFPCPAKTAGVFDFITSTGSVDIADTQVTDLVANYLAAGDLRFGKHSLRTVQSLLSGYLEKN